MNETISRKRIKRKCKLKRRRGEKRKKENKNKREGNKEKVKNIKKDGMKIDKSRRNGKGRRQSRSK